MNWYKIGFFSLMALIVVGLNAFLWLNFKKQVIPTTLTTTPTAVSEILATPTVDESALIKQAVYRLTGSEATKAEIAISENTGRYAKGTIKEYEAVGGAYWLAAKTDAGWVGVYAGQATPKCSQIEPYGFPTGMVPDCL